MNQQEIKDYLEKLKEFEQQLNSDELDSNLISEINNVLNVMNDDVLQEITPKNNGNVSQGVMVKVKKLDSKAVIPSYAKVGDAGMDLTITQIYSNTTFDITYGFGIAMEIPKGYVGLVFPRSSIRKTDLSLTNCVGVIDSGYRGELQATFKKIYGKNDVRIDETDYKIGDRGAQIIILPYPTVYMTEVPELSDTDRGSGGFGSTGN